MSNPMRFGEERVGKMSVHAFLGREKSIAKNDMFREIFSKTEGELEDHSELVKQSDSELAHLFYKVISNTGGTKAELDLEQHLTHRVRVDHVFK